MELFEEDVWDILDQENNLREIVEVSDEWLEYVTKEFSSIDVKAKDVISAAVCLLSILRITIDLSDYVNTVYMKEQSSGNVLESNFHPIAKNAFKATNKEYLFLHAITYANWKSLVLVKSDGRSRFLSLSIQGRRFLREQLGEIPVLPKIEPDEFKKINPYVFDGEGNPVTNLPLPLEPPPKKQNDASDAESEECLVNSPNDMAETIVAGEDGYNGPEPASDSPGKQFDAIQMITKKDMVALSGKSRKWIDRAISDAKLSPCFIPKIASISEGFWREKAMTAIEEKKKRS